MMPLTGKPRAVGRVLGLTLTFLLVELLDELVGGVLVSAWPLIADDLRLSYGQLGFAMALATVVASVAETLLYLRADPHRRQRLIVVSGVGFAIAIFLLAISPGFGLFLVGLALLYPASGGFVNLCQATLMDLAPQRHEQNMARWVLAGSVGNLLGPPLLTVAIAASYGWRESLWLIAALLGLPLLLLRRYPMAGAIAAAPASSLQESLAAAATALRRPLVRRWLILQQCADLLPDLLLSFVALYFVDVVGQTPAQAGLAVTVWLGLGLLGDFLLLPLLEKVPGLAYLRVSAALVLVLYPAFLLVPQPWAKLAILGGLGFLDAGWYSILQGQLYTALPGQSSTVMILGNLFGLVGGLVPLGIGLLAQQVGLGPTLVLLLISPVALLVGLPKLATWSGDAGGET